MVAATFVDATDGVLARNARVKERLARLRRRAARRRRRLPDVRVSAGALPLSVGGAARRMGWRGRVGRAPQQRLWVCRQTTPKRMIISLPAFRRTGTSSRSTCTSPALPPVWNAVILLALSALVFWRIGYVYPSRTPTLRAPDDRPWRLLGRHRRGDDPGAAASPGGALRGVFRVSGLLHGAFVRAARPPAGPAAPVTRASRVEIAGAIGSRRSSSPSSSSSAAFAVTWLVRQGYAVHRADARRWRHLVSRRRWPALVPDGRAPARRAAQRDSRAPAARLHRDRGPPVLRASRRRSHRARPRRGQQPALARNGGGRQHADAAAGAHAVSLEQEDLRPEGCAKRCWR